MTSKLKTAIAAVYTHRKKKKELNEFLRRYYLRSRTLPYPNNLWSTLHDDGPMGKRVHQAITKYVMSGTSSCCYCQDKIFVNANVNIEHILPRKLYPQFTFEPSNLAAICLTCNAIKSAADFYNLDKIIFRYKKHVPMLKCYHPNVHIFRDHVSMLCIQTNYVNIRTYVGKTLEGQELCSKHLINVTNYTIKAPANPIVATAVVALQNYIINAKLHPSPILQSLLANLVSHI